MIHVADPGCLKYAIVKDCACFVEQENDRHRIHATWSYGAPSFCYPQAKEGWSWKSYTNADLLYSGWFNLPNTTALQCFCCSNCKFLCFPLTWWLSKKSSYVSPFLIIMFLKSAHNMNISALTGMKFALLAFQIRWKPVFPKAKCNHAYAKLLPYGNCS